MTTLKIAPWAPHEYIRFMREKFQGFYSKEVENASAAGKQTKNIIVHMGVPMMREELHDRSCIFMLYKSKSMH